MGQVRTWASRYSWCILFALVTADFAHSADKRIEIIGAIAAGSPDGKVPEWSGGQEARTFDGGHHRNPYAHETPIDLITAENYEKYGAALSEGLISLLKQYPDSFSVPLYQSHRSVSYPDWFYRNTKLRPETKVQDRGSVLVNAYPGVAFPEPSSGLEVIWNHLTRWRSRYFERDFVDAVVYPSGEKRITRSRQEVSFELFRHIELDSWKRNMKKPESQALVYYLSLVLEPANLAGGALLAIDYLDQEKTPRKAWSYDVGQKRVKRLPYVTHDNSALMSESLRTADDTDMFNGSPERFQWNLLGRQVMIVPYNNYDLSDPTVSYETLFTPKHLNPEFTRFEHHRVWVVEAILLPEELHIYTKRRFYIDEDSWSILMADQYDARGNIWRVNLCFQKTFYEVPLSFCAGETFNDLKRGSYYASGFTNEERSSGDYTLPNPPVSQFTPAALRARVKR